MLRIPLSSAPVLALVTLCFANAAALAAPPRTPRPADTAPGSCDGFLDFSSETLASNYQIVSQTPVGGGIDEVEISLLLENLEATALRAASLRIPDSHHLALGVVPGSMLSADFPALSTTSPVANTETLVLQLPSANVASLLAGLNDGSIPVTVDADEDPVLAAGVAIEQWSSTEDAGYAFARDTFTPAVNLDPGPPPYEPGALYTVVFLLFGDGIDSVLDHAAGFDRFYLVPDPNEPLAQIPAAMQRVRVIDVMKSAEDDENSNDSQDGVTFWTATLQRTEAEPLDSIYASASFCTGEAAFVDRPVESTRLFELDRIEPEPEERDANVLPIRFNVAPIPTPEVEISGQIQGYALRPSLELRVRPSGVRVAASVDTDLSFTAEARAKSGAEVAMEELSLWSLCFPLPDLPAGPVPIGMNLQIDHRLDVAGSFEAGAVVGFQKSFEGGHTVGYDSRLLPGDPYFGESRHVPHPVAFTPPQLTEETGVHAEIATNVVTTLRVGARYPICDSGAGAALDARAFGTLDVLPAQDPWWTLGHGVELGAALDFQILGFDVARHEFPPVRVIGGETRASTPPPLGAAARHGTSSTHRHEGEDQRWAVAIDDVDVTGGSTETSVAARSDGSVLLLDRQPTGRNSLVTLDRFGAWQETRRYALGFLPKRVLALPDDSFVVAGTTRTFLSKHAPDGADLWAFRYEIGDASDGFARCEVEDAARVPEPNGESGIVVVGRIGRALVTQRDACAFRVDANGALVWARMYVDAGVQDLLGVTALANGDFAAVGSTYPGPDSLSNGNPLVVRIAGDDGSLVWAKSLPTYRGGDQLRAVAEAPDGTIVAVGGGLRIVWQTGNALLVRIAADGSDARHGLLLQDATWEGLLDFEPFVDTQGGDTPYDMLYDIAPAPGGFVITGKTSLATTEAPWIAKLNTELAVEWFGTFDGAESDALDAVVATPDGFLASGWSDSLTGIGQGTTERWPWLLKLPFEGMLRMQPEAGITSRYLQPGIRWTSGDPEIVPNGIVALDAPLQVVDPTIATVTAETDPLTTPQEICVHRLTATGRISTLDGCADDLDDDGTLDDVDNCVGTANASQTDSDGDGHGDFCDADLDQSGFVDATDYTIWRSSFGLVAADPGFEPSADLDGDGAVDLADFALLRAMQGAAPGAAVAVPALDASDAPLVEVIFPATGTNQIAVEVGESATAEIRITPGVSGLAAYDLSLAWSEALAVESTTELLPAGFDLALTTGLVVEDAGAAGGSVSGCDGGTLGDGVLGGPFVACTAVFKGEIAGIETSIVAAGALVSGTGADPAAQAIFVPGTIEVVPEPDAMAAGIAALVALAARRRRP